VKYVLAIYIQDNELSQFAASVIGIYDLEFVRDIRNIDPMKKERGSIRR